LLRRKNQNHASGVRIALLLAGVGSEFARPAGRKIDFEMTGAVDVQDPYAARPWLAFYPSWALAEIDESKIGSLCDMFLESAHAFEDRPAIESFGVRLSYGELRAAAVAIASFLQAQGLEKGERVAIMSPNVASYPAILFGILLAGGVVVNVNPLYRAHELEHQINDSGARFIFVLENFAHTVAEAWPVLGLARAIVSAPGDLIGWKGVLVTAVSRWIKRAAPPFAIPGATTLRAALRVGKKRPLQPVEVSRDDIAFLQYTGGTTGVARGAVLLHRNVMSNLAQALIWLKPVIAEPPVIVTALPLYHIFGLTACLMLMVRLGGSCLLIANPRDIPGFVEILRKSRFTMFSGVNTLYAALIENKDFAALDFSQLRFCISGGMATQDVVARRWKQITGRPIVEGYGLSETSPVVAVNRPDIEEFSGAIGYPQPSTLVSIRGADGAPVPIGERGELCVKGPQVMAGYWKRPKETAEATTADGFFRTGDVAVMGPDGLVRIVDRLKEMILVSGFNVYPNELENVLTEHPKVKEAAVIGAPDPRSGEVPIAFIVPRDPSVTCEELAAFMHERLTGYKAPKRYEFRDALPKSAVGKVLRRVLKEEYCGK
jgi:long-chain acyl-CoA synthetase